MAAFIYPTPSSRRWRVEVLSHEKYQDLLNYLPAIKSSLKEWQLVDIQLADPANPALTIAQVVDQVYSLFKDKEGKIYTCNAQEIVMLIRWGKTDPALIPQKIETKLPAGSCKILVQKPTVEGLGKLEILVQINPPASPYADMRKSRRENVVLVADDDMYMRLLVNKGSSPQATVHEAANGDEVVGLYKQYVPDILFLDIHLPGQNGMNILAELIKIDPEAHIIMLSADSSRDNVEKAVAEGAKGFMAKPFTKEKLIGHLKNCPTFTFNSEGQAF
jgi:two-component system chemotaxis response regulator CheY